MIPLSAGRDRNKEMAKVVSIRNSKLLKIDEVLKWSIEGAGVMIENKKEPITREDALKALDELFDQASDVPEMSAEEIDDTISEIKAITKTSNEK